MTRPQLDGLTVATRDAVGSNPSRVSKDTMTDKTTHCPNCTRYLWKRNYCTKCGWRQEATQPSGALKGLLALTAALNQGPR